MFDALPRKGIVVFNKYQISVCKLVSEGTDIIIQVCLSI